MKTFAAGIMAVLISYWLEVKEPQWSLVTVYLLSQPMVGAILSKSAYRLAGTFSGAVYAVRPGSLAWSPGRRYPTSGKTIAFCTKVSEECNRAATSPSCGQHGPLVSREYHRRCNAS